MPSSDCAWTIRPLSAQLHALDGSGDRSGSSTVGFLRGSSIQPGPQVDYFAVAGAVVALNVRGANGYFCEFGMSAPELEYPIEGATETLTVTPNFALCNWVVSHGAQWVTVSDGNLHSGVGTVSVSVAPNPGFGERTAYLTVGTFPEFPIDQNGDVQCTTMNVSPTAFPAVDANGQSLTAAVRFAPGLGNGCGWWAESLDLEMMELVLPSSNPDGDGDITIQVFGNGVPAPRTGTLQVSKPGYPMLFTITVTQCGTTGNCSCTGEPPPPPGSWSLPPANGLDPGGTRLFVHSDALGSVRMLTDDSQTEVARYDYQPFGQDWQTTGAQAAANKIRFAGGERETDVVFGGWQALDYFGARYYQSQTGRFTRPDLPGLDQNLIDPQGWNLYTYVRNNPVRFIDPDGHQCVDGINPETGAFCAEVVEDDLYRRRRAEETWESAQRFFWDTMLNSSIGIMLISPTTANFSAGFGDSLSLGLTGFTREKFDWDETDPCSGAYSAGGWLTAIYGTGRLSYAGLAKGYSIVAASGAEASALRTSLKAFWGTSNWRKPNLAKYLGQDDLLRAGAGRTNASVNALGAGWTAAASMTMQGRK